MAAQPVVYVRAGATGTGDGTSWANAFRELRTALAATSAPAEIWVAEGTYHPGLAHTATFALRSGLGLYGGFAGDETARDERDPTEHRTVLSGEIGDPQEIDDNVCHIVTGSGTDSTAVLDGFSVTGAYAYSCTYRGGGGLYNAAGSPTIRNVRFHGNVAVAGAGVANVDGSDGTFEDCVLDSNQANGSAGMLNFRSSPRLERVAFRNNLGGDGSALANAEYASPLCVDCTFEGNTNHEAGASGAVINDYSRFLDDHSTPIYIRAVFRNNTARYYGGAMNNTYGGGVVCIGCLFEGNTAHYGGAVTSSNAPSVFVGCVFRGNEAEAGVNSGTGQPSGGWGGAIRSGGGDPSWPQGLMVVNSVIVGNVARFGGAIYVTGGGGLVTSSTLAGNRAWVSGGGVYVGGSVRVENSVVWGNARYAPAGPISDEIAGAANVRHSIVRGGFHGEVVLDEDPLYVRAPFVGGLDDLGDVRPQAGSPVLDSGLTALLPDDAWDLDGDGDTSEPLPFDLLGESRTQGVSVDMGAYEGAVTVAAEPPGALGERLTLAAAPDPARGDVTLTFDLRSGGDARVTIYDLLGRQVTVAFDGPLSAGAHRLILRTDGFTSGTYVARLVFGDASATSRLTVLR
jgi:hypothetical protein